jgi:hypothetical protein
VFVLGNSEGGTVCLALLKIACSGHVAGLPVASGSLRFFTRILSHGSRSSLYAFCKDVGIIHELPMGRAEFAVEGVSP